METLFTTAISLTEKEAKDLIAKLYTASYTDLGDGEKTHNSDRLKMHSKNLFLLLTLPIGSKVLMVRQHQRIEFKFNYGFKKVCIDVYDYETSTPKDIALTFIHSKNFVHFKCTLWKCTLRKNLNLIIFRILHWNPLFKSTLWKKWKSTLSKPKARIKDQSVDPMKPKIIDKIDITWS